MFITIVNRFGHYPVNAKSQLFLTWDDWNDWSYLTYYGIFYIDEFSNKHELGGIKIAYFEQKKRRKKIKNW